MKRIYFDLDGTLYPLYQDPKWLERLLAEDETVFAGGCLYDKDELADTIMSLQSKGYEIGVITWLPKDATAEYEKRCAQVKREWVREYLPMVSDFNAVSYGKPKQQFAKRAETIILVDDDDRVRAMWDTPKQRKSIDAKQNIIDILRNL